MWNRTVLCVMLLICLACSSQQKKSGGEKAAGPITQVTGKIKAYPDDTAGKSISNVYLVSNWKTRSCVNFLIENGKEFVPYHEKVLQVKAVLLERQSQWSGKIRIIDIIKEVKEDREK